MHTSSLKSMKAEAPDFMQISRLDLLVGVMVRDGL